MEEMSAVLSQSMKNPGSLVRHNTIPKNTLGFSAPLQDSASFRRCNWCVALISILNGISEQQYRAVAEEGLSYPEQPSPHFKYLPTMPGPCKKIPIQTTSLKWRHDTKGYQSRGNQSMARVAAIRVECWTLHNEEISFYQHRSCLQTPPLSLRLQLHPW